MCARATSCSAAPCNWAAAPPAWSKCSRASAGDQVLISATPHTEERPAFHDRTPIRHQTPRGRRCRDPGAQRRQPAHRGGRVRRHHGPLGLRQDDAAEPAGPGPWTGPPAAACCCRARTWARAARRSWRALRAGRIGFVFQSFNLVDELSVADNVGLALRYGPLSPAAQRTRVAEVLEQLGIAHRAAHHPRQLSGGQQQRVAIARAIAARPALLLADEPTGNLDSAHGAEVMRLLGELNAGGTTLVMVTHSAEQAARAGRCLRLLDGRAGGRDAGGRMSPLLTDALRAMRRPWGQWWPRRAGPGFGGGIAGGLARADPGQPLTPAFPRPSASCCSTSKATARPAHALVHGLAGVLWAGLAAHGGCRCSTSRASARRA